MGIRIRMGIRMGMGAISGLLHDIGNILILIHTDSVLNVFAFILSSR